MELNNNRKLCLVIPSFQAGGMERVMSELAGYFALRKDIELHLILYGITREIFYPVPGSVIIHKPSFRFSKNLRFFHTLRTLLYLRRTIKEIEPVSILSFGELWNSFVLLALAGLNYPVYISDRCSPARKFNTFHTLNRKILYPRATGIIAQTGTAMEIYRDRFRHRNIRVIGNPIKMKEAGNRTERENIVLMVGRLIRSKHQDKLIELFLKIDLPGWRLVLVGYDHLQQNNYERLQEIISRHNAGDRVFLEGKQADVDSYYSRSKIFAFTSSSEGFPNAIGEAMAAGLPVVAFDCIAGPSDMIRDNSNGFLIPLFDYDLFQAKLELLMRNGALAENFGRDAREDIKKFSTERIGREFLDFILDGNKNNGKELNSSP
jgi:glycosyltransferase involved in cell wall biosynthesis